MAVGEEMGLVRSCWGILGSCFLALVGGSLMPEM